MSATQTMPAPVTTDAGGLTPSDGSTRLWAMIRELEGQYPPPDEAEVMADRQWLDGLVGDVPDDWPYWNCNLIVYRKQIVGVDPDWLRGVLTAARVFQVHPSRIVTSYVGELGV